MKAVPVTMKQAQEFPLAYLKIEEGKVYKEAQNIEIEQVSSPQNTHSVSRDKSIGFHKSLQVHLGVLKVC